MRGFGARGSRVHGAHRQLRMEQRCETLRGIEQNHQAWLQDVGADASGSPRAVDQDAVRRKLQTGVTLELFTEAGDALGAQRV